MAFLFKSKKSQDRGFSTRDAHAASQPPQGPTHDRPAGNRQARDEKNVIQQQQQQRATPTGSLTSLDKDGSDSSPAYGHGRRGGSTDTTQQSGDPSLRNGLQSTSSPNASLYPWSQRRLTYTSPHTGPFPRYGAAVNATSSKEGDVYLMGGLINSSTVKGDLWMIEAGGNMACYPLATTAEGPGPRVGHSSLLVGNAFIVYGGDTKIDDSDVLDETLYLLNTSTRHWSRALPAGPRPSGRYGHTLNILGSKIYIFGGQVEGFFMNDLSAFDLNQLQMPNNRWEILMQGEASPKMPAARTNHSMITYNYKMYLFGGTNGFQWFNDVWCYDSTANAWTQLDCIGYIPAAREGHSAALVDDVMYIFGGRTEEGSDLGDLAAFRISSRRWYTFQNMGPSPSPRSGHSMTTVGKSIVVLGGEPSTAASSINDLGVLYVLDTTKIRYPNDGQQTSSQRTTQSSRPSTGGDVQSPPRNMQPRDPTTGSMDSRKMGGGAPPPATAPTPASAVAGAGAGAGPGNNAPPNGYRSAPLGGPQDANGSPAAGQSAPSKLPRAAVTSGPAGPPPQGPTPAKPGAETAAAGRVRGPSVSASSVSSPQQGRSVQSPVNREVIRENEVVATPNGRRTPTTQPGNRISKQQQQQQQQHDSSLPDQTKAKATPTRLAQTPESTETPAEPTAKAPMPSSPPHPTRQSSNPLSRRSSGRNSQTVALLKELDSARNRNAWYASELELARKAGYVSNAGFSPALEAGASEAFDDEDRPLVEGLLAMRTELANVQSGVDKQAVLAAKQIAQVEKQRDAAIQEAIYAKARLAAQAGGNIPDDERGSMEDRASEMSRKLASTLNLHRDLQLQLDTTVAELEAERRARKLADETAAAAESRMSDLEAYKTQTSADMEQLKAQLHLAQREAREQSVACAEAIASLELVRVEKAEMSARYDDAVGDSREHSETFESLRSAMVASQDARTHLETKLEDERMQREVLEEKYNRLKAEHEAQAAELVAAAQRLQDAQELAEKHVNEAKTHRQAVISGLDKISARDLSQTSKVDSERVNALQNQVANSSALAKKYKEEADAAADKLRSAEERIAGLEQYQEQASREGVSIRRQLQASLMQVQNLQAAQTDIHNRLAAQQLETNAMTVQNNALKGILGERGISPTSAVRNRALTSPHRASSPEQNRLRDLESQLMSATAAHEETKQAFAAQAQESEMAYREKLSQLESDYQSAVHYVKGTEKMLKQLKDQLTRYKTDNSRLKSEIEELENRGPGHQGGADRSAPGASDWEGERSTLQKKVERLEGELRNAGAQLEKELRNLKIELAETQRARDDAVKSSDEANKNLDLHRRDLEQLQSENSSLEQRAADAEQKVSLLLDQVESSVDSYRRQSRQAMGLNHPDHHTTSSSTGPGGAGSAGAHPNGIMVDHSRSESSDTASAYGGNGLEARNSVALDHLATELETLRSHWEATNKNYRLSSNFEFDQHGGGGGGGSGGGGHGDDDDGVGGGGNAGGMGGMGLSKSLADWRKRLDTEDSPSSTMGGADKAHPS